MHVDTLVELVCLFNIGNVELNNQGGFRHENSSSSGQGFMK